MNADLEEILDFKVTYNDRILKIRDIKGICGSVTSNCYNFVVGAINSINPIKEEDVTDLLVNFAAILVFLNKLNIKVYYISFINTKVFINLTDADDNIYTIRISTRNKDDDQCVTLFDKNDTFRISYTIEEAGEGIKKMLEKMR